MGRGAAGAWIAARKNQRDGYRQERQRVRSHRTANGGGNLFIGRFDGTVIDSKDDYINEQGRITLFNAAALRLGFGNSFGPGANSLVISIGPTISTGFGTSASVLAITELQHSRFTSGLGVLLVLAF